MSDAKAAEPEVVTGRAQAAKEPTDAPRAQEAATTVPISDVPSAEDHRHTGKRPLLWTIGVPCAVVLLIVAAVWLHKALTTVSTDDAYVNGHVTFVAPRVAGQVARVLVDDNNRVRKGDLLVQLDKEPYQVQLNIAQAAVASAEIDLTVARFDARAAIAQTRSLRFSLERAIDDVGNQVALLRSKAALLASEKAKLDNAQSDYDRVLPLMKTGAVPKEEVDHRKQALIGAQAQYEGALQDVYQIRAALGLKAESQSVSDLTAVPENWDEKTPSVLQAEGLLMQAASKIGVSDSFSKAPRQLVDDFYKRDPEGNIDRIYAQILKDAPAVKQAEAKLVQAQRNLDQARLNLSYCDVVAEIDGVVTRRNVNPGNNVITGQSLMAVRSLTEVWIDANFKETQLASLRIGQPVDVDVDMYGRRKHFKGRISGFTMGTGSSLALLPPENATGNFVKVVQRLPVRIDLLDYDPDKSPLFVGLSVTPTVYVNAEPAGPDAGLVLQPFMPSTRPTTQP